jgi:hypothetical protein
MYSMLMVHVPIISFFNENLKHFEYIKVSGNKPRPSCSSGSRITGSSSTDLHQAARPILKTANHWAHDLRVSNFLQHQQTTTKTV